jgi:hypothetical protein
MAGDARELASAVARGAAEPDIPSPDIYYASPGGRPQLLQGPAHRGRGIGRAARRRCHGCMRSMTRPDIAAGSRAGARHRRQRDEDLRQSARTPGAQADRGRQAASISRCGRICRSTLPRRTIRSAPRRVARVHDCAPRARGRQVRLRPWRRAILPAGLTAADPGIRKYIAALARSGSLLDATLSVYKHRMAPALPHRTGGRHHPRRAQGRRQNHRRHRHRQHRRRSVSGALRPNWNAWCSMPD